MQKELRTIDIQKILQLSAPVREYAIGNDFILGEANGASAFSDNRILEILKYPIRLDGYIVFFLKKGSFKIDFNLSSYEVRENSLLITVPGNIIRLGAINEEHLSETELIFAVLSRDFISGLHLDINNSFKESLRILNSPCIVLNETELPIAESYFRLARTILQTPLQNKRQVILELFSSLVYLAEDIWSERLSAPVNNLEGKNARENHTFEQFMALVNQYHNSERGMQFYADKLCLTPKYLCKIIKKASGRSGPDWIDSYVILEAKNLLRYSGDSIKEIVVKLNFPNSSSFNKYFRLHAGMSPSEYRRGGNTIQPSPANSSCSDALADR
ncbi:MAG: helix-turn-helix domain-containing protein [Bacteroidales bacterium]|nr:helix-turn-helix domain-containing protein [Bacteroidales bacterium]